MSSSVRRVAVLVIAALAGVACGRDSAPASFPEPPPSVPQAQLARATTSAAPLLAMTPAGAELILELDLERVRDNPVVGSLYAGAIGAAAGPAPVGLDYDVVRQADIVVVASYAIGTGRPESLVFLRGQGVPDPGPRGVRIDARTIALGTPDVLGRFEATRAGQGDAVTGDEVLMRLRDAAMPEGATAAAVRLTALLPFDARLEVGKLLGADAVPESVSLWGDVVDDLAVVALLGGDSGGEALARELATWRARLLAAPRVRELFLSHLVRDIEIEGAGDLARVVFIVSPRTLERVARRLSREIAVR